MNNPYEKKKRIFTPEVIAELAAANKVAREKKYPFLKDYVPAPVFVDNLRRMKWKYKTLTKDEEYDEVSRRG